MNNSVVKGTEDVNSSRWGYTAWTCGCRDAACTQSYWQVQNLRR